MPSPRHPSLLILAALALWPQSLRSAPFSNGSFEDLGVSSGSEAAIETVSSWTATGSGMLYLKNGNAQSGATAHDGTHLVSFGHGDTSGNTLSQTFDTVPGKGYAVNYWVASIDGTESQVVSVEAFDAGASLATSVYQYVADPEGQWTQGQTYSFTATSTSTTLVFKDEALPWSPQANWALDDVTVTEITYPAGKVLAWGLGSASQAPDNLENVTAIAAGQGHALALKDDGTVVGWGADNWYQIQIPDALGPVKAIAAGGNHSLALQTDGTVIGWGEDYGDRAPPAGLSNIQAIADSYIFSAAVRADGTVAVWGDFVAVGVTTDLSPPAGLADVKAIATGLGHILALKQDGSVIAWGEDDFGQATVPVAAASGVKAIVAAPSGSFAIKDDGELIAWGEVGAVPDGLTHVRTISCNDENFVAVKPDGSVVCWGLNSHGQSIPAGLSSPSQVAAGGTFSVALTQPLTSLPDPLEFTIISADPGTAWEFTAKFPDQTGLQLRVQTAAASALEEIDEGAWIDLPNGGIMDLLGDGEGQNWHLTADDIPFGHRYFRVIAAAPDFANSTLVFSTPFDVESPAGKILYTSGSSLSRNLMLMESDGSDQTTLTDGTLSPLQCALGPGGIRAAFVTLDGGLYVMKAQAMNAVDNVPMNVLEGAPVTASFSSTVAWSPDGKRLAFAAVDNKIYVLDVVGNAAEIQAYDATSNPLTPVVDTLSSTPNPAWSPDGRHLALLGANYIQVFQITDSAGTITPQGPANPLVALTDSNDFTTIKRSAAWSPDGQQLAVVESDPVLDVSFISVLNARDGDGTLTPESAQNERLPLYDATDTPKAESVSWSRDGSLLAVGAVDGFTNYVEVFKPDWIDANNPRVPLTVGTIGDGAFQPSFGSAFLMPPPQDDLPESTGFEIVRGLPGLPWTFSILQTSTVPGLVLRVESTLTPDSDDSWEDLPGGSLMEREGDLWTLLTSDIPLGNRYFRVVAEAAGLPSRIAVLATPYLVERQVEDTTPPTLAVTHAWVEKINGKTNYRLYLDPRDETGFDLGSTIFVRTGPDATKLQAYWRPIPWSRGQPMGEPFTGSSITIEVYAQDAAGNKSTVQRRVFKSPLPISTAPNLEPRLGEIMPFQENAIDCRGLFAANFDSQGLGDDILQIDRGSGEVRVRRQGTGGAFVNNSFFLAPGVIDDSSIGDFDGDGDPDIAIALEGTLKIYYNQGLDGDDVLQFSETIPAGLSNIAIPNIAHCVVGDVTGEGRPDIVMVGNSSGGAATVGVLVNDDDGEFTAATAIAAGPGIVAGAAKLGDVNGDGLLDAVVVDTAGNQLVVFRNKGQGLLAGFVEPDPDLQPRKIATGDQLTSLPAQALAVGDVTGDGRADAVVVMHWFTSTNPADPTDTRDHELWQVLDGLPDGSLHPNPLYLVYQGPKADSGINYDSDVLLQDLTGDRFPELIFTSHFEDPPADGTRAGGILVVRLNCQLDEQNKLTAFDVSELPLSTDAGNPHRLAAARFGADSRKDIVLANASNPQLQWIFNGFTTLTKPMDIVGAITSQSDPEGTEQANGGYSYIEYPGGFLDAALTYANNTVNAFTGAVIESQLPANLELVAAETDSGYTIVGTGATRVVRWTENISAGGAGVKRFRARFLANAKPGTAVTPKIALKGGGKTFSNTLPKVTVQEPILLEWSDVQSFSDPSGSTARLDDTILYKVRLTNLSPVPVANTVLTMAIPTGTVYDDLFQNLPDIEKLVSTDKKKVTFTITHLNPGLPTPLDPRVDVLVKAKSGSIKATMMAQRPGGLKRTLPVWTTTVANSLGITVTADRTTARPGDIIEYTVTAKNWGSSPLTGCRVVNAIPIGTKLLGARIRVSVSNPNFAGQEEPELVLNEDTLSGDRPGYVRGAKPHLFWEVGDMSGGDERVMVYRVMVGVDVPTEYYPAGIYSQVDITNNSFNFTALTGTSLTRLTAFTPAGAANKQPADLLPKVPAAGPRTTMSAEDPLPRPKLTLQKTAVGARDETVPDAWKYRVVPMQMNGAIPTYFVINDKLKSSDGRVTFLLCVANSGSAEAEDVFIHDVLPEGFVFEGFLGINGQLNLAQDLHLSHFFDKAGKEMAADPALFPNYRSFDLLLGDLQPGEIKTFYYQAYTTKNPVAKPISSFSGGIAGITSDPKLNGLSYTAKGGFYVQSRELHFPVNGQPAQLDLVIGDPLVANFAVDPIVSRSNLSLGEQVEIQIPYEISGTAGLAVDPTLTFTVPKGYQIEDVSLQVTDPQSLSRRKQDTDIEIKNTTAGAQVKMKLGNNRVAFPTIRLSFDAENQANLSKLRDKNGYTINPLNFFATITGGYSVSTTSLASLRKFGVPLAGDGATTSGNLRATSTDVHVDAQSNPDKDSAVFVGRSAPMFVRRGQEFTYTVFIGNQTALDLGPGSISMRVPHGCVATKATLYKLNAHVDFGDGSTTEASGVYGEISPAGTPTPVPAGTKVSEISWKTPIKNTLVTWKVGEFNPAEAGAVTLTVKLDDNFVGDRIDDDTCWFRVANAMDKSAGPLGVVVLPKNEETAAPEVVQKSIEGMGLKYSPAAGAAVAQKFRVGTNSCSITIGGANYAQLEDSTAIIMLPKGRVMVIGQPNKVEDYDTQHRFVRVVRDSPELRIVVGPGTASEQPDSTLLPDGVVLTNAPGYPGTYTANRILSDFVKEGVSLLGKRKANIILGGGPTLVLTGANTLPAADAAALLVLPAPVAGAPPLQPVPVSQLVTEGAAVLSHNGNAIVAAGGGNIVAGGGGNIVAAGGGNIVAAGGGNVVANDGAGIVAAGGGNIVAGGGMNDAPGTVSQQAGRIVAAGGGNILGQDAASIVAGGGGNIVAGGGGNLMQK